MPTASVGGRVADLAPDVCVVSVGASVVVPFVVDDVTSLLPALNLMTQHPRAGPET